jgi:hypothetical protein|tara:strand:- start:508 stop:786 length:279 start_codon:yes stop_codon:yes gene_type:complete
MIKETINYFKESYRLSPLAFYCELGETILVCGASAILTYTVLDPATRIFVPMFFVGSILGVIATFYRKAAFATILTMWFVIANFIALLTLFG